MAVDNVFKGVSRRDRITFKELRIKESLCRKFLSLCLKYIFAFSGGATFPVDFITGVTCHRDLGDFLTGHVACLGDDSRSTRIEVLGWYNYYCWCEGGPMRKRFFFS